MKSYKELGFLPNDKEAMALFKKFLGER